MAVYPTFNRGMVVQLPFTRQWRFLTSKQDMDSGIRYSFPERSTPLHAWVISYSALDDTETATLVTFFSSMGGQYGTFTFTDPQDATAYPKCRFGMEDLAVNRLAHNQNA